MNIYIYIGRCGNYKLVFTILILVAHCFRHCCTVLFCFDIWDLGQHLFLMNVGTRRHVSAYVQTFEMIVSIKNLQTSMAPWG